MPPLPLTAVFDDLPDPRRETANQLHALTDILVIATCAVIGGAETWAAITEYGRTKADSFRRFLPLAHGVPSPDTFERVFAKLAPGAFAQAFGRWLAGACEAAGLVPIAIDGKSADYGHGRRKERYVTVIAAPAEWPNAAAVQVNRVRRGGGMRTETHYYQTGFAGSAAELAGFVRGHWGIENGLHWVLDVVFREDDSRVRAGHAGADLAMVRRVAVSLLRRAPGKGTTTTKRLRAGWDDDYLLQVLQGIPAPEVR